MDEKLLSIAEVADMLNISRDTVRRMFSNEPGVINVGPRHEAGRQYRVLRIPLGVLNRVMSAREVNQAEQAGRTQQ
jgi:excisionase family DNA binding protein